MKQTEKMIESRKEDSLKKIEAAREQINRMLEAGESVTVRELVKRTGFSRAFFYVNEPVHEAVLEAQGRQKQKQTVAPCKETPSRPKDQRLIYLEMQNERLQMEAEILRSENRELRERLKEKEEQQVLHL